MFSISSYDPLLLKITAWFCYLETICITGFVAHKFIQWLRFSMNYVVLLYAAAIIVLLSNLIITLLFITELLTSYYTFIGNNENAYVPYVQPNTVLTNSLQISSIASFVSMWIASIVVLNNRSKGVSKAKFWIVVSLPLIYYLIQYQPSILQILAGYRYSYPILFGIFYTLFFSASTAVGGILFGCAFWSIARKVTTKQIRDFMIITGYGLVLFFVSNQVNVLGLAAYPPFGIATKTFIGLSAYMILIGFYSLAISLAQDINLRQKIRTTLNQQSVLLDKIGTSEMEKQMQKKVVIISKKAADQMSSESGIQTSLSEQEIKDYIDEVLSEIKDRKASR